MVRTDVVAIFLIAGTIIVHSFVVVLFVTSGAWSR